ncbi:phosphoglycerol geranylgeranyltransferase [Echinicola rosea]|uniref:Geranylgeranylglyceryl phosphate synthase n=1 Tax=Echinicola rosea TaxID=1807691 RepID=A0ABQ1V2P8_9BACT|nr:geranylgeranylglyceryl/heptaprenylglyceryl phosphate synthase [Echinicola rosea]GGF32426.1 geranylgeranylglyceryl phosphate synthase [Echinicola rosea]
MPRKNKPVIATALKELRRNGAKGVALLIDPEKCEDTEMLDHLVKLAASHKVDFIFLGGSLIDDNNMDFIIQRIKRLSKKTPLVLFPGNAIQVTDKADGILFLSLISGRNPELLIGQQVTAAPLLEKSSLEVLPTGYMLVNDGQITSASYISQTIPLPNDKPALAVATALAGQYLGMQYLFLDAGSGAKVPVSKAVIRAVHKKTDCPLIVGGGIDSVDKARNAWEAGADLIVLGNGAEKNPGLLTEVTDLANVYNLSLNVN